MRKREERAQRFGIWHNAPKVSAADLDKLYKRCAHEIGNVNIYLYVISTSNLYNVISRIMQSCFLFVCLQSGSN